MTRFITALLLATATAETASSKSHSVANWWGSFDRYGWSNCNTKDGKYKYIDGLWRNHRGCERLYCIEQASCSVHMTEASFHSQKCYNANWWGSFDRKGWSTCNNGYFLSGLMRNSCDKLYCLEEAKCCKSTANVDTYKSCYNANWWGSFDNKGWSKCSDGHHLAGLYRNDCHSLYCIEMAKCCKPSDPVTSFPTSSPTNFPTSFPTGFPTGFPTPFPVACIGEYGDYSECTKSCASGTKTRAFAVTTPAAFGGAECAVQDGHSDTATCNADVPCPEPVDVEMTINETPESFTEDKKTALIAKIAKQLGLNVEDVEITVGDRRLMQASQLLITVTIKVLAAEVGAEVEKLESKEFRKATGCKFQQFKPSHGSVICATCKWDGHHIKVTHYINAQKHGEKGLQHKCYHKGGVCKCVCK